MIVRNPKRASTLVLGSVFVSMLGSVACVGLAGVLTRKAPQNDVWTVAGGAQNAHPESQPAVAASRPEADTAADSTEPAAAAGSRAPAEGRPASRSASASRATTTATTTATATATATMHDPFFLPEERSAGTTLAGMWQRTDDAAAARRTAAENAAAEAAARAAQLAAAGAAAPPPNPISETDLAAARALQVRGVVRAPHGVWVVLANGRFAPGEPLPGLPFVVDAVLGDSVVLRAGATTVHLPITRPGSRPGAVKAIQ